MKLSVIAPTYNEAANIERLISELESSLQGCDYEIVIADDNSPDLTWAQAESIAKSNRRVRTLRRMGNRGLGPAVVDGFMCATGDAVACIDADLQHDPSILPEMLRALQNGSEVVVGSRYVDGGGVADWNWARRLMSVTATKLADLFLGIAVRDPMSGYFMLWRADFCRICPHLKADGFKILLEILAQLRPHRIHEVPYTFRNRAAGTSKLSRRVIFAYLLQLSRLGLATRDAGARPQPRPSTVGQPAPPPAQIGVELEKRRRAA